MANLDEPLDPDLLYTATWVVAGICTFIVLASLLIERILHYVGRYLKNNRHNGLYDALQKLKEELMLLGFISLLLAVFQSRISRICVKSNILSQMHPCQRRKIKSKSDYSVEFSHGINLRRWRILAEGSDPNYCARQGKVRMLSVEALQHLHVFIFVLAIVHVAFCATTMILGGARIRQWKHWEDAIKDENYKKEKASASEHEELALPHDEFVQKRAQGTLKTSLVVSWMISFCKQFYHSITLPDYRALRSVFIMRHCESNKNFDFDKYMMRCLEDDFNVIVGIRWYQWVFVIVFLLLNISRWHSYFWLSLLPMVLLLVVGTKLEQIITLLAQEAAESPIHDNETPELEPTDHHFWFRKPKLILFLIHFILFQNSFELAFLFWVWGAYGFRSCIMEKLWYIIPRLIIGLLVQVLCSYSTMPLYVLVTQMGGMFKQSILEDELQSQLHGLTEDTRERGPLSRLYSFCKPFGRFCVSSFHKLLTKTSRRRERSNSEVQLKQTNSEIANGSGGSHKSTVAIEEV